MAEHSAIDDVEAFMLWCNNPDGNNYPSTVVSIVEHTRDRIAAEYLLTERDTYLRPPGSHIRT